MNHAGAALYHECRAQGGVVDLSDRTQLILTGADRVRYLNGQVTNDVRKLRPAQTQAACVTTAKGKLCADIFITAQDDALVVDADASLREALLARLERYIVADDVAIEDATDSQALLHFFNAKAPEFSCGGYMAPARRFGRQGWDVRMSRKNFAAAREELFSGRVVIDETLAELLRIEAGIPRWGRELDENTLPPEAGLEETHIDYHKGCYIGQETISRLRSIGHVNRRLTGFVAEDPTAPAPGASLFAPGGDGPAIGLLTSTAFSFALEKTIALGYLKRGSPAGALHARPTDATGASAVVTVQELPFVP